MYQIESPLSRYRLCAFLGKGRGGTPHMHGHKESYKDLNLKIVCVCVRVCVRACIWQHSELHLFVI